MTKDLKTLLYKALQPYVDADFDTEDYLDDMAQSIGDDDWVQNWTDTLSEEKECDWYSILDFIKSRYEEDV
jgi:hypothetical protein